LQWRRTRLPLHWLSLGSPIQNMTRSPCHATRFLYMGTTHLQTMRSQCLQSCRNSGRNKVVVTRCNDVSSLVSWLGSRVPNKWQVAHAEYLPRFSKKNSITKYMGRQWWSPTSWKP
jgi:hypothetical protein